MRVIKNIQQRYSVLPDLAVDMEIFRCMVNDCLRLGIEENRTSMKSLSLLCYPHLKRYTTNSKYKLCAISRASGILKNYTKLSKKHHVKQPYCTRPSLVTCYDIKVRHGSLHLPGKLRIPLNDHVLKVLSDPSLEIRSVTLSASTLSISVLKRTDVMKCTGMVGIDRNLNNVTLADSNGEIKKYDFSKATEIKFKNRNIKQNLKRNDVRVRKRIFSKYGRIQRDKVNWILHNASKHIVDEAFAKRQAIVMENLKGIRKLYRKGNGQGTFYRGRMNGWSFFEFQRQVEYKAHWLGLPVVYVNPSGTSCRCSRCGDGRMFPEENRRVRCSICGFSVDRDVNAARNLVARGLRFKPVGSPSEAMVTEPVSQQVIRKSMEVR